MSEFKKVGVSEDTLITTKSEKHVDIDYGDIVLATLEKTSVNNLESNLIKGIEDNKAYEDLLYKSDFYTYKKIGGRYRSRYGQSYAVLIPEFDKSEQLLYREYAILESPEGFYRKHTEVFLTSDTEFMLDSMTRREAYHIYFEYNKNGKKTSLVYEHGYIGDNKSFNSFKEPKIIKYKDPKKWGGFIPGAIINNNEEGESDWGVITNIIIEMNRLGEDIGREWEHSKAMYATNKNFTNGSSKDQQIRKVEEGSRNMPVVSSNGITQPGLIPFPGSAQSMQTLLATINWLEDKAHKYALEGRDSVGVSGANKQTTEVSLFNLMATLNLINKSGQRSNDYTWFFNEFVSITLTKKERKDKVKVKVQLSQMEQAKIDRMVNESKEKKPTPNKPNTNIPDKK